MTAATYTTNLTEIIGDTETNATTNWSALGGGASGLNAGETDYFIEGSQCLTKNAFASATKGMIYNDGADFGGSGTDGAYSIWATHLTPNSLDTIAAGGLQFLVGSSTSDFEQYYIAGNDTVEFGGWVFGAINEATAGDASTGTPSTTVEQYFGVQAKMVGGPTKGAPLAIDTVRAGRHDLIIEFGTGADPEATFDAVLTSLETATNRWGLLAQRTPGGDFENSGLIQFGTSTNAVEFNDSDKVIFIRDHPHVTANFNTWEANNASSIITFTNLVVKALGTTSTGRWLTNNNPTMTWTTSSFIDMGAFTFGTNSTIDTCTFNNCGVITPAGATMNGSNILASAVAADDGALFYDETADPDGELNNMTFSKGTNAHHAIRFGTSVPAAITLRGCDFSGFGSTDDANDSVFRFDDTAGSITLNLVGCTNDGSGFTIDDAAGVTVTVVIDPVTTLVHVDDDSGVDLSGASVYLAAADGTGDLAFNDSITSISRSGTTATVTTPVAHGLSVNDLVNINGITDKVEDNYGTQTVASVPTTTTFTYTTTNSGSTSYTGTITYTGVIFNGTTDVNGDISDSRTFTTTQPVVGTVRKSSAAPFFKNFPLGGSISNTAGLTINVQMVSDE
jgi:hypothetical protein